MAENNWRDFIREFYQLALSDKWKSATAGDGLEFLEGGRIAYEKGLLF